MSFLAQAFQSQSANNTTSIVSAENSTKLPLGGQNGFFQGTFVPSSNYSVVQLSCLSNTLVEIVVESSFDGVAYNVTEIFFNTQEDIDATRAAPFYGFITLPFVRILITNIDTITNTVFEFCTKLTSTSPPANQIDPAPVIIIGTVQVQDVAAEASLASIDGKIVTCDTGAVVVASGNITETNSAAIAASVNAIDNSLQSTYTPTGVGGNAVSSFIWAYNAASGSLAGLQTDASLNLQVVETNSAAIAASVNAIDNSLQSTYTPTGVGGNAVSSFIWAYNAASGSLAGLQTDASLNLKVVEKNSDDILTTVNSIDSKIVICDTSDVTITGALPEGTNSIGYVRNTAYNVSAESWQAIQIDAGDVKVVEKNSGDILTAVNSIDSKIVTCDTGAVVVASGNITVDNFPATQPVSGSVEVSSIIGALPEGTNSIGIVNAYAYNLSLNTFTALTIESDNNLQVVEKNSADILTSVASIDGKIIACDTGAVVVASGNITVDNFPATQPISGSVTISGTAQVQDLPLENIAGINAPRPVYNMVVGNWYRVANPGNTSGAVWIQIGAPLFNGATLPDVGVLFKCLYVYLNFSTTGTVWDEPYNTWEADNLVVTAGDLQVVEKNSADILTAVNSIDSKIVTCNTDSVTITTALPTGANTIGAVNLRAYSNIIPDFVQLNSVPNSNMNDCLCVSDLAATNIEINANKTSYVENLTGTQAAGSYLIVDMLTNENRYRNATVMLNVTTLTYPNPSVMFGYSEDNVNYYFDGNLASFYDLGSNNKSCVLQRTQVPSRYLKIYFITDTDVVDGHISLQKS